MISCIPNMNFLYLILLYRTFPIDFVRLDQDILSPLAGKKQLYTYETMDFWEQIKTPGYNILLYKLFPSMH